MNNKEVIDKLFGPPTTKYLKGQPLSPLFYIGVGVLLSVVAYYAVQEYRKVPEKQEG